MKQVQWLALATGTVALATAAAVSPAEAATITYGLQGATLTYFVSGVSTTGALTGTFDFDDAANTYSNIALNSPFTGGYVASSAAPGSTSTLLTLSKDLFGTPNAITLFLSFANPLGSLPSIAIGPSFELVNPSVLPTGVSPIATVNGGSVVAIPTPLLLPSLIGLGVAALRRRKAVLASAEAEA